MFKNWCLFWLKQLSSWFCCRFLCSHHAHLYPTCGLLPPPSKITAVSLPSENWGKCEETCSRILYQQLSHCIIFPHPIPWGADNICKTSEHFSRPQLCIIIHPNHMWWCLLSLLFRLPLSLQATVFLVVGIIFMIGSLSLIALDWIHNPPGSGDRH